MCLERRRVKRHSGTDPGSLLRKSSRIPDLTAVLVLIISGLIIAAPLLNGGYRTYMDNPVHLAEIGAAAHEAHNGWSDIAFCGFPIGTLHSPLWYGALALLVGAGLSADLLYAICLSAGFLAPSLALYYVARRRMSPLPAASLAYLLLVQRTAVVGIGSALGGMWTFYLAAAGLILLTDRMCRPCRSGGDLAWIAGLVGLILLTHLFPIAPLGLLTLAFLLISLMRKRIFSNTVLWQAAAGIVGIAAASAYWLPLFLAGEHVARSPQHLSGLMVVTRLLLPTHLFPLLENTFPPLETRLVIEALPMLLLVLLGIAGFFRIRRRKDDTPLFGAILAGALLLLLIVIAPHFEIRFLGPVSWRLIYIVRIALALAALPLIASSPRLSSLSPSWPAAAALSAIAAVAGLLWGGTLREVVPDRAGAEMKEVRKLWSWIEENRDEQWGRIYLQDTFTSPRGERQLEQSHVLALTSGETGARQLGPSYGIAPYRTATWTRSEFGTLYNRRITGEGSITALRRHMWLSNATHIVTSHDATAAQLLASPLFGPLYQSGRYTLFAARRVESTWASGAAGEVDMEVRHYDTGRIILEMGDEYQGEDILVRVSYHPLWRLNAEGDAVTKTDGSGLLRIHGLPEGSGRVDLEFLPSPLPRRLSLIGWLGVLLLAFLRRVPGG